jgi:hypothetical protein
MNSEMAGPLITVCHPRNSEMAEFICHFIPLSSKTVVLYMHEWWLSNAIISNFAAILWREHVLLEEMRKSAFDHK